MRRFAPLAAALLLSACSVPGLGYVGGGPLPFYGLAVTDVDASTGKVSQKAYLAWEKAPNARSYELSRAMGDDARTVIATVATESYTDDAVVEGKSFSYRVRALSGDSAELTTTDPLALTPLAQTIAAPTDLVPANQTAVAVGETPKFSWKAVPGATYYYVKVNKVSDGALVWSTLTTGTDATFGAPSPLKFSRFDTLFPVGPQSAITAGVVYRWTVSAIKADAASDNPDAAHAVDVRPTAPQTFYQGG